MAYDLPFDQVDHLFGNIGGMVPYPFDMPGDQVHIDDFLHHLGMPPDIILHNPVGIISHGIDFTIHFPDRISHVHIHADQGIQAHFEHFGGLLGHGGIILLELIGISRRCFVAVGDIHGIIGNPLQVVVDLDHGDDQPQVRCNGLI